MNATSLALAALAAGALLAAAGSVHAQPALTLPAADRPLVGRPAAVFSVSPRDAGEPGPVAFDAADNLYVLDRRARQVVVFSPTGSVLRRMGAGTLQHPLLMSVLADGQVAVADLARGGLVLFGRDGALARSVPFARVGGLPSPRGLRGHPRGGVVTTPLGAAGAVSLDWYALDAAGGHTRFHQGRPPARTEADSEEQTGRIRIGGAMPVVFAPELHFAVLPGGEVAFSDGTGYRVELRSPSGQPLRTLARALAPRPVTRADQEAARREREALAGSGVRVVGVGGDRSPTGGTGPSGLEALLLQMTFARVMPVVQGLAADPAGVLWIGRAGPAYGAPAPIDLVTPTGRYLGTVTGAFPAAISRGGLAAYVERSGEGPRVVVRRLPAAWRRP